MDPEFSVVMPCLNERGSLPRSLETARRLIDSQKLSAEIIVADNRSTDGSPEFAASQGARVVDVAERGYGRAVAAGIAAARGRFVIMADSDASYDFEEAAAFLPLLRRGDELVMGDRFAGRIHPGAMPRLHRLGVPALSWLARTLYGSTITDFHCGLRGFSRSAIEALRLETPGMEYASEMIIHASLAGLRMSEVPVSLFPDGRGGRPPHLRTWSDGWRHLIFLLSFLPRRKKLRKKSGR